MLSPRALIWLIVLVDTLGYGLITPLLPFYAQQVSPENSALLAGGLRAVYAALQILSGPVWGALSDRVGRKPVLLVCLLGTGVAYLLMGVAESWWVLMAAVVLDGLTGANIVTAQAYLTDSVPAERRAGALGQQGAAFGLGVVLGPALGGAFSGLGLGVPVLVAGGVAVLNVLVAAWLLPESLPAHKRSAGWPAWRLAGWSRLRLGPVWLALGAVMVLNVVFNGLQTVFPLFAAERYGWQAGQVSGLFAWLGACAVLAQGVLVGALTPRWGEVRLVHGGLLIMLIGVVAVSVAAPDLGLFLATGAAALGSGLAIAPLTALLVRRAPLHQHGQTLGQLQVAIGLGMILGPALSGGAYQAWSGAVLPALGAGAVALAWILLAVWLYTPKTS